MLYESKTNTSQLKSKKSGQRYSSKEYSNPFFTNRKRGSSAWQFHVSSKIKIIISAVFIVFVFSIISLLYLPYFDIKQVNIDNQGKIEVSIIRNIIDNQLGKRVLKIFPQKNIFLFSTIKLKKELEEKFVFEELDISTKLPSTLNVFYIEEKYAIIYEEDEKYYYIDDSGNVIEEVGVLEINLKQYPILKNNSGQKIQDRKIEFDKKIFDYIIDSFNIFKQKADDLELAHFQINQEEIEELWLVIKDGPTIYLNINEDFNGQMEKLLIIKGEKLKENFWDKEYIDLRFGDSIYYR
jgi:hypothetical protein